MFTIAFVLRLLTGLLSLAALAVFARALLPTIAGERRSGAFYPLPAAVRFPALSVCAHLVRDIFRPPFSRLAIAWRSERRNRRAAWRLAGLLCGLAFESRYQSALLGLGLFAWAGRHRARCVCRRWRPSSAAGWRRWLIGALADRWGYGAWVFPPLGYFNVNIVQGVAARTVRPRAVLRLSLPAAGHRSSSPSPWW